MAGGVVTRGAIHLIETGKSRPSMRTLEVIASRTRKPISFFLTADAKVLEESTREAASAKLDQLEQVAATDDATALRDTASRILETANSRWLAAHAGYYLGRSLVGLSEPDAARPHLRRAHELFVELGDRWMVVECMDWEAGALSLLDLPEALTLAEECLARCRELSPVPLATETRILGRIAAILVSRHRWNDAVTFYDQALRQSGPLGDLGRTARTFNELSLAYLQTGDLSKAASYSHKALGLHELRRSREAIASSHHDLAVVLIKQGQLDDAEHHLRTSLALFEELGLQRQQSHALLSLGELSMVRTAYEAARSFASDALEAAQQSQDHLTMVLAHQLLGELAAANQHPEGTDREFGTALDLLSQMNVPERLIECQRKYAEILEERGDTKLALEHLKMAVAVTLAESGSEVLRLSGVSSVEAIRGSQRRVDVQGATLS